MKLIPVIDLMYGSVVTAKCGRRETYAPSNTPLCKSSEAADVLSALLHLSPFDTCYIADLDAIGGGGSNLDLIHSLSLEHPDVVFWIDNGLTDLQQIGEFARPVIGTESLANVEKLTHLVASLDDPVLSLDFIDDRLQGLSLSDLDTQTWPRDVIVMNLSRVGSDAGPDNLRLEQLSAQYPAHNYYLAGGVRNQQDLKHLRSIGAAGVLLSTALHQGHISSEEISRFLNA